MRWARVARYPLLDNERPPKEVLLLLRLVLLLPL